MRSVVVLPAPLGPRKPWISPGADVEADAVDGGEAAVRLDEIVDGDHRRSARTARPAAAAGCALRNRDRQRRRGRAAAGRRGSASNPGASSRSSTSIFSRPMSGRIAACLSRPPRASRRCVASAGNWLSVGSTGSQQPAAGALVEVHLRPRVVVERAAHEDEADGDARRDAERARHRDVERRVLVAVADLGAQHLARRRQADRRLLLEQRVDVAREPLGAGARRRSTPRTRRLGLRDDLRRVALDERLRARDSRAASGSAGPACSVLRIAQLDDVARRRVWPPPCEVGRATDRRRRAAGAAAARRAARRSACLHRAARRPRPRADRPASVAGTAIAARALGDSRTVIRPSGLSSRTTSPVSVTHDVGAAGPRTPSRRGTPESAPRRRRARARACRRPR